MRRAEVEDYEVTSAFSFADYNGLKHTDEEIEAYGCDEDFIKEQLAKKYPRKEYFTLIDYDDENCGSFRIRVFRR